MGEKKRLTPAVKVLLAAAVLIAGLFTLRIVNGVRNRLEKQTRFMMDTYVTIYAAGPRKKASLAVNRALDRMQDIDRKMNPLNPESPLYEFNRSGKPIDDPETVRLVRQALSVSEKTDGAFDITVFPLAELWGFSTKSPRLPSAPAIAGQLKRVGYRNLQIRDGKLHKLRDSVAIDLGAVAKGYAVGEAVRVLKEAGITSGMIDAGGDIYAIGKRNNRYWRVGIKAPRGDGLLGSVEVEDLSVACSGDYERFFEENGKRYHHIFNPRTGYPAEGVTSVTVIYPDCALTDAWSTALFVLGPGKGMEVAKSMPGMEVLMVTSSGERLFSDGLRGALKAAPDVK